MPGPDDTVRLGREHADELAADISTLGAWLYQAPQEIRRDFARHAFPEPDRPGANVEDFILALNHSWQHLCDALRGSPRQQ